MGKYLPNWCVRRTLQNKIYTGVATVRYPFSAKAIAINKHFHAFTAGTTSQIQTVSSIRRKGITTIPTGANSGGTIDF
ncbi:MAG: hypothetical protein LBF22_13095 [Deltaproteobacteria bacterium]|nr:hypothetical protein [Deltaproteobacteria bacterium]